MVHVGQLVDVSWLAEQRPEQSTRNAVFLLQGHTPQSLLRVVGRNVGQVAVAYHFRALARSRAHFQPQALAIRPEARPLAIIKPVAAVIAVDVGQSLHEGLSAQEAGLRVLQDVNQLGVQTQRISDDAQCPLNDPIRKRYVADTVRLGRRVLGAWWNPTKSDSHGPLGSSGDAQITSGTQSANTAL